jgi:hypothetical protein
MDDRCPSLLRRRVTGYAAFHQIVYLGRREAQQSVEHLEIVLAKPGSGDGR